MTGILERTRRRSTVPRTPERCDGTFGHEQHLARLADEATALIATAAAQHFTRIA